MPRRRTRRKPSFQKGRQGLWIRYATFTPSDIVTAPKYTEDAVIFPSLWEREVQTVTQPKRGPGGPLLKRMFGSVMWAVRMDVTVNTINTPYFEVLVFAASTTEPAATAAADFNTNLENQRVLHYSMAGPDTTFHLPDNAGTGYRWYATMPFDIKVAARLAGEDIVISTRCSETETVDVAINPRIQVSAYITTP